MCQNPVSHPVDFNSGSAADKGDTWWRTMPQGDNRAFLSTWHLPPTVRLPLKEKGMASTTFASCTHAPAEDWLWQQVGHPPSGLGGTRVCYPQGPVRMTGFEGGSTSSGAEYRKEQELHSWLALLEGLLSDKLWKRSWWRTCEEKREESNQCIVLSSDLKACLFFWLSKSVLHRFPSSPCYNLLAQVWAN